MAIPSSVTISLLTVGPLPSQAPLLSPVGFFGRAALAGGIDQHLASWEALGGTPATHIEQLVRLERVAAVPSLTSGWPHRPSAANQDTLGVPWAESAS